MLLQFVYFHQQIALGEEMRKHKQLSLNEAVRKKEIDDDKTKRLDMENQRRSVPIWCTLQPDRPEK